MSCRLAALCAALWACAAQNENTLIAPTPAYYPRLALLRQQGVVTTALAAVQSPQGPNNRLILYNRSYAANETEVWNFVSVIAQYSGNNVDLANSFLYQLPNETLLCAYRHHDDTGPGGQRVYRIQLSASHDYGQTWSFLSTVVEGPIGVWEPFLFSWSGNSSVLQVTYSAELTNGGEQDIVFHHSTDGGATWSSVMSRLHTPLSRNGMPGVVEVGAPFWPGAAASLVVVFEGFWTLTWSHFTVNYARSFDGGITWPEYGIVHAPSVLSGWCSGSPQIGYCPGTGKLSVVYMSNENGNSSIPWPAGAHISLISTRPPATPGAPLNWTAAGHPGVVPTLTPTAFWPSFFLDYYDDPAPEYSLRVAYQCSDGGAGITDSTSCVD